MRSKACNRGQRASYGISSAFAAHQRGVYAYRGMRAPRHRRQSQRVWQRSNVRDGDRGNRERRTSTALINVGGGWSRTLTVLLARCTTHWLPRCCANISFTKHGFRRTDANALSGKRYQQTKGVKISAAAAIAPGRVVVSLKAAQARTTIRRRSAWAPGDFALSRRALQRRRQQA